jgi:hypothetical protein
MLSWSIEANVVTAQQLTLLPSEESSGFGHALDYEVWWNPENCADEGP